MEETSGLEVIKILLFRIQQNYLRPNSVWWEYGPSTVEISHRRLSVFDLSIGTNNERFEEGKGRDKENQKMKKQNNIT